MSSGLIHDATQESRIRQLLEEQSGDGWVSALELSRISLQYCARICCLRKAGMKIENRIETVDGTRHGFYRIARPAVQGALIPDLVLQQWMDPEEVVR
jgi:hypothetical protein